MCFKKLGWNKKYYHIVKIIDYIYVFTCIGFVVFLFYQITINCGFTKEALEKDNCCLLFSKE